ncbi:hypothetical protein [Actinomadura sp. 21ATH]|uniref:hypothetical protein n=1 Tax=Actinomadura sp. 21ATH TaxID=1735444 RepID=UPI0035C081D4
MSNLIHLLDARALPRLSGMQGVQIRPLIGSGALVPIEVGRTTYYRWSDVLAVMPKQARARYGPLAVAPVASGEHRSGLAGYTVSCERATRLTALSLHVEHGALVAVERVDGRRRVAARIPDGWRRSPEAWAERHAARVGARYVDARHRDPAYPAPGSTIPDQPGYVVGTCEHRVAKSEWRAGFRTCERCLAEPVAEVAR